jgi:leucyl aminopeptidase (aminopeptidase T)
MDIDPKLAELLNKVRKGATSDMRVGAWEKVLTHLGYRCKIVKDRNTAVEFRVVTPDGTELVELKNPDYKWITMGDMSLVAIHQSHLKFVFKIGHRAQSPY